MGQAERALGSIIHRIYNREAFGGPLYKKDSIRQVIAEARLSITQCRQLCYLAAAMADEHGFKAARKYIAMIKVAGPRVALKVVDEAIQIHGAHGVSQDSGLSGMYTGLRTIRVADGPDIVHLNTIVKQELAENRDMLMGMGASLSGTNHNIEKYGIFAEIKEKERAATIAAGELTAAGVPKSSL
jgi:acyl-CoA dehydrogenase